MISRNQIIFFIIVSFFLISCISNNTKLLLNSENPKVQETIDIDYTKISPFNNGIFEGWGTTLCWWANRTGIDKELSTKIVNLLFTEEGLNLNIARYNIGGGDDPEHTHITRSDSNMEGFLLYNELDKSYSYDWTRDSRQVSILKEITKNKNIIVEFFSNSPPYFMTLSKCSSGNISGRKNNLDPDFYENFADYLATVCDYFQNQLKINITSLSPINEPNATNWKAFSKKQEGCHYSQGISQSKIFELTRTALDNKGLNNIILAGTEESSINVQINSIKKLTTEGINSLDRINTHTYYGYKRKELKELAAKNNKQLWVSETDAYNRVGLNNGEMGPGLALGRKIIKDFNGLQPSAWVMWQAVGAYISTEGFNGKKNSNKAPDYSKGIWGLITADFDNNEIILSKKFYSYAQFTKFINPGDRIINLDNRDYLLSINSDETQMKLVCVSENEKNVCLNLHNYIVGKIKCYRTSGIDLSTGDNCSEVFNCSYCNNDKLYLHLIPNSITTFVLDIKQK